MKVFSFIFILILIMLNFSVSKAENPSDIAINYLIQRFGSANYEITKTYTLGNVELLGISDNKNYYVFKINLSNNRILDFEAKALDLNFKAEHEGANLYVECLGTKNEGFGIDFNESSAFTLDYYYQGHKEDNSLTFSVQDLVLLEFVDSNANGIPDNGEKMYVINLNTLNHTRSDEIIRSPMGLVTELDVTYKFGLEGKASLEIVFTIYPSSTTIANLTSDQKMKGYEIDISAYLSNYNRYIKNSSLLLALKVQRPVVSNQPHELIFYNDGYVSLSLSSPYKMSTMNSSIYLTFNNYGFTNFKINYNQLKQFVSTLANQITILISAILLITLSLFLILRYKKIKRKILSD